MADDSPRVRWYLSIEAEREVIDRVYALAQEAGAKVDTLGDTSGRDLDSVIALIRMIAPGVPAIPAAMVEEARRVSQLCGIWNDQEGMAGPDLEELIARAGRLAALIGVQSMFEGEDA